MAAPSSSNEPELRSKLHDMIALLDNIETKLVGTITPEASDLIEEARKKLAGLARSVNEPAKDRLENLPGQKPVGKQTARSEFANIESIPELSPNPILEITPEGKLLYANSAAKKMFPDLEIRGLQHPFLKGWSELVVQATCEPEFHCVREAVVGERIFSQSIFFIPENNQIRIYGQDITASKLTEEELRLSSEELNEQRAFLQAILQQIPVAVGVFDAHSGKQILSNPAREAIWRYPQNSVSGFEDYQKFLCFHPDGTSYRMDELPLIRTLRTGQHVKDEMMHIRRGDGTEGVILANSAPVYMGGELIAGINILSDITDRVKNELALQESEEMYRRLVETSYEGIWAADAQQRTSFVNRRMAEMLGYTPEEMKGRQTIEFMDAESKAGFTALIERRRKGVKESSEYKFVRKDGSILWVLSNAVPIFDKEGTFTGSFGMLTDITAMKMREKELQNLNRTLRAISASSQAMMHAQTELEFIQEVCRIVVEDCGHAMVWVGFAEDDPGKTIKPVASFGFEEGYLEKLKLTWADTERGRGPGGTAIRTGKISLCRNMLTDPNFVPWRGEATKRGYASSIVLPFLSNGRAFGELTIYSREVDPYTPDEIHLLSELANDLAYGIMTFRLRAAQAKADEDLKASEQKYRSLFNGMTEGFALHEMIYDEKGKPCDFRFLEINQAFEKLTGLKRKDVIGKLHNDILKGNDTKWVEVYGRVVLTGEPVHFENYSPALKQHYEVFAYRPAPGQFAALFLNITARKEMEKALRQAHDELETRVEERTQELEAANAELIVEISERQEAEELIRQNAARSEALADISSRLTATNLKENAVLEIITRVACDTLGDTCVAWLLSEDGKLLIPQAFYHPDPEARTKGWELIKSNQAAISQRIYQEIIKKGKGRLYSRLADNDIVDFIPDKYDEFRNLYGMASCMIVPLRVEGEIIGGLTLIRKGNSKPYKHIDFQFFQSLTDRAALAIANARLFRSLESALQQEQNLRKQLIQVEKNLALNRMVASVAHEINNPIQTIVNCLFLLRGSIPPEGPEHDALEMASSETRRIAGLVQQLRELYRPGADRSMQKLKLKAVLDDVHRLLQPHLQQHHVEWREEDIPGDIVFSGIPDQVKQVFLNLGLNAVDAMEPEGGWITVKADIDHSLSQVKVSFTDTGEGIPFENQDRIFEPFFTTKTTGTGLGLSISFDIVQNHGGKITVESLPGQGSTFTVWLPLEEKI